MLRLSAVCLSGGVWVGAWDVAASESADIVCLGAFSALLVTWIRLLSAWKVASLVDSAATLERCQTKDDFC